jgi:hypothetical protein
MRKTYFVKYYDKGSTVMAADQISEALSARGYESRSIYPTEIPAIRDAILVFIKTSRLPDLVRARRLGNKTVLDVQDTVVFKRRLKNRWLFDGLIFKNDRQVRDFATPSHLSRVIYHQWDPRYAPNRVPPGEFRIAYVGLARSFSQWGQFPGVVCFDSDYFRRALDFNCHFSVRETEREFLYKPNCKVSTAAGCDANLVTTRDITTLELLGPDYPFYAELTAESLTATLERARESLGGPEWRRGLEVMREVKERTSMDRIIDDYVRYFEDLG